MKGHANNLKKKKKNPTITLKNIIKNKKKSKIFLT